MDFFKELGNHLVAPLPLKGKRMPTMYPSAASCRDLDDPTIIHGACIRQQWYRCVGYAESDPSGEYSQYIFAAGNMWESWLIEKAKTMGIYVANSLKWAIPEYHLSGEVDIVIRDPSNDEIVIIESKTYSSANYQAKSELLGIAGRIPMPKVQNVMQSALYLQYFSQPENGGVNKVFLTYLDRSCGGPECNQQFNVTLDPVDNDTFININTKNIKGEPFNYRMPGISMRGIFARYSELINAIVQDKENPPPPDYCHVYTDEKVIELYEDGKIAKTKYENWKKNKTKFPIGDWQCSYCNYKTLCKQQKDIEGYS